MSQVIIRVPLYEYARPYITLRLEYQGRTCDIDCRIDTRFDGELAIPENRAINDLKVDLRPLLRIAMTSLQSQEEDVEQ